ncbi:MULTISPECIES: glycosyltransferase [unclassified Nocardioides]|uniref:glycosyltransferase n=1 Tax=unclassified Nocardioides TaxID=2615069 RepID=UPI003619BAFD
MNDPAARTVVVHITESLGGGTASAISDYVDATPEVEHHLVAASREGVTDEYRTRFHSTIDVDRSVTGVRTARAYVRTLGPDFVHLHSSWAALGYRLLPRVAGPAVLYTPHCFAFERRDVNGPVRLSFFLVERLLRRRTDSLVACAPREQRLARKLGYRSVHYVPNRAGFSAGEVRGAPSDRSIRIVGAGRLSAQKDPRLFAQVARKVAARVGSAGEVTVRWIGDGSPELRAELESAGVEVTGWLPRSEVVRELKEATVLLHTASWEGFPVLLIEAHELGLPIVVRRIPAFEGLPDDVVGSDADELADVLQAVLADGDCRTDNQRAWRHVLADNNRRTQSTRLRTVYGVAGPC